MKIRNLLGLLCTLLLLPQGLIQAMELSEEDQLALALSESVQEYVGIDTNDLSNITESLSEEEQIALIAQEAFEETRRKDAEVKDELFARELQAQLDNQPITPPTALSANVINISEEEQIAQAIDKSLKMAQRKALVSPLSSQAHKTSDDEELKRVLQLSKEESKREKKGTLVLHRRHRDNRNTRKTVDLKVDNSCKGGKTSGEGKNRVSAMAKLKEELDKTKARNETANKEKSASLTATELFEKEDRAKEGDGKTSIQKRLQEKAREASLKKRKQTLASKQRTQGAALNSSAELVHLHLYINDLSDSLQYVTRNDLENYHVRFTYDYCVEEIKNLFKTSGGTKEFALRLEIIDAITQRVHEHIAQQLLIKKIGGDNPLDSIITDIAESNQEVDRITIVSAILDTNMEESYVRNTQKINFNYHADIASEIMQKRIENHMKDFLAPTLLEYFIKVHKKVLGAKYYLEKDERLVELNRYLQLVERIVRLSLLDDVQRKEKLDKALIDFRETVATIEDKEIKESIYGLLPE